MLTEEEEFEKWKEKNGKSDEYMDGHIDEKDFEDYEDDKETVYDTDDDQEDDKVIPEKSEDPDNENSQIDELKDLILNLSTKVDDLTQKVIDDAETEETEETIEDDGLGDDFGSEDEDPFAEEGDETIGDGSEGEGGESQEGDGMEGDDTFAEEGSQEGGDNIDSPEGSDNGEKTEEPKDYAGEDDGEGENIETRQNEAWLRAKESGLLNLSSGSLISKLFNENYYDIDEIIVEVVKKKIRKLIDESKRKFVNKAKEVKD